MLAVLLYIKVNCTGCQYCMPCPVGVNIPKNFAHYNKYHMLATPQTEGSLKMFYNAFVDASEKADKCVECGKCEGHCPHSTRLSDFRKRSFIYKGSVTDASYRIKN